MPAQEAGAIGPLAALAAEFAASIVLVPVMLHFRVSPEFAGHLQAEPPPACVAADPRFAAFAADLQQDSHCPMPLSAGKPDRSARPCHLGTNREHVKAALRHMAAIFSNSG
jgi:hypothetical protein